ncbi:MAG: hypothetical protein DWQ02_07470 [Bacteroidetes bacterium]|nr:MAG: hypothetical protein DWQ02_07470 [Bacteroidota bacterium]
MFDNLKLLEKSLILTSVKIQDKNLSKDFFIFAQPYGNNCRSRRTKGNRLLFILCLLLKTIFPKFP